MSAGQRWDTPIMNGMTDILFSREAWDQNARAYEIMARVERDHWWYEGRRRILAQILEAEGVGAGVRVLDVGCGTGPNLSAGMPVRA